jgi:putative effector of murein hydrolase LrgA (UPF0299 family)
MVDQKKQLTESARLIRWRMAHERFRFADEFRIVPRWLKGLAIALFVVGQVVAQLVHFFEPRQAPLAMAMGVAAATALGADLFLLFFGYVNRDAERRGMNSTLWTLLVIFVPYLIGVIIYFLVREPLLYICPGCRANVSARFNFCPNCKLNLRPSCPQCKQEVRSDDKYCPYCAEELATKTSPQPEQVKGQAMIQPAE